MLKAAVVVLDGIHAIAIVRAAQVDSDVEDAYKQAQHEHKRGHIQKCVAERVESSYGCHFEHVLVVGADHTCESQPGESFDKK